MGCVIQEHVQIILRIFYVDSNCKQYKLLVTMWTAVLYDSSPAWVLLCCFKSPKMANFLLHCKHVNCSSEYEFFSCFSNHQKVQFFCQCEQLNGSTPAWVTCSCCVRLVGLTKKILIGDHCQLLEITDTKDYLTTKHAHCSPNHK